MKPTNANGLTSIQKPWNQHKENKELKIYKGK